MFWAPAEANDGSFVSFDNFTIKKLLKKSEKIRGPLLKPELNDENNKFLITISC